MKQISNTKQQAGFTLIELVMVIVILGILAAVALPKFTDMSASARTAVVDGTKGAITSAAVTYYAANKVLPTEAQILTNLLVDGVTVAAGTSATDCTVEITATGGTAVSYAISSSFCQ
ncbi:MAG: type II secretion system protein [Methylobacter sp.]|jgi:MSHA pilin protein MshA